MDQPDEHGALHLRQVRVPWSLEPSRSFTWKWQCAYCGVQSSERTEVKAIFNAIDHVLYHHMPVTWLHYGDDDIPDDLYSGVIAPYVFAPDLGPLVA